MFDLGVSVSTSKHQMPGLSKAALPSCGARTDDIVKAPKYLQALPGQVRQDFS